MHLILYQNIDHIRSNFIEETKEYGESFLVQRQTRLWHHFYPYSNSLAFYNDFFYAIMRLLGSIVERVPRAIRDLVKPHRCWDKDKRN